MVERKVTANRPGDLVQPTQRTTGQGAAKTVRQGRRLVAAREPFGRVSKLRGAVKFSVNLKKLRHDR